MSFRKRDSIVAKELRVEKLHESHADAINDFYSYEDDLKDFIQNDALVQQDRKISVTYLWFLRGSQELVGFSTLCPDCVKLKSIDKHLAQQFRDKRINYGSLPALKIGRLCVDDRFLNKGIGTLMIKFAIHRAIKMGADVGCRFLYLDAKRNQDPHKDAIHFYKKMGFGIYREKRGSETPMYMDIFPLIENLTD